MYYESFQYKEIENAFTTWLKAEPILECDYSKSEVELLYLVITIVCVHLGTTDAVSSKGMFRQVISAYSVRYC